MEVILLEDVKALGKKGDKVKVNDGYARNFILPKKLGVEASAKNINDLKLQKANEERIAKEILEQAQAFAKELEEKVIVLKIKLGKDGRTFGSISTKEISIAAKEQLGYDIDKKKLQLAEPIKNMGTFHVPVKLHQKVTGELTVKVTEQ
ncbi:MAG TPA: 50S ribosomal protein L9 [Lachnospiraceae bacterium]|jgi:large subunit ribosomal protein L9|uniref:Large ribosomal subunit protein bL9 n=1 Tax=Anaerosporobacter mobilis DSM 15930 TaxID=1120996 RepID=A0A1M7IZI3_9FIRM|nr:MULTISPECIES: 50S ribosomal protein L9 [Anaerosporobacter]MBS5935304.1 50S ribosomal protein L9 [Clostridiales bacterium]SHM45617.1 large subunit ribosomal protein L9 [Anaerosporobacter mobilis DSM 15930]HAB60809.1 50S ribosomal protein L9 [Lachnospiraceae bacterium]